MSDGAVPAHAAWLLVAQTVAFDPRDCNNTALRLAARRIGALFDEALEPVGLKATQVSMLSEVSRLATERDGINPALQELADALAVQISAITHALAPLLRDGLVVLQPDGFDRRVKRASLTALGKRKLAKASALWEQVNQRVETAMGSANAEALRGLAGVVASDAFLERYGAVAEDSTPAEPKEPGTVLVRAGLIRRDG